MTNSEAVRADNEKIIVFLTDIGLVCHTSPGAGGFCSGVEIRAGELYVDLDVVSPSSLLHEAGHLALIPSPYRSWMSGNLFKSFRAIFDDVTSKTEDPDNPVLRAVIQATDPEATAWAWAAGKHLGLPENVIIEPKDYQDAGEDVALMLRMGRYLGINGLMHAGFTQHSKMIAEMRGEPLFPQMKQWLQSASW